MDHDDGDDEPVRRWIPPDDRLWRHPSEAAAAVVAGGGGLARPSSSRVGDRRLWPLALTSGVLGAFLAVGAIAAAGRLVGVRIVRVTEQVAAGESASLDTADWVVRAVQRVSPALVQVRVASSEGWSAGSGVVFRDDGSVLTSEYVVQGATQVQVVTADGEDHAATVLATDPLTGVAVVRVEPSSAGSASLRTATLASASRLRVGQRAAVVGAVAGQDAGPEVSVGVVSALGRQVPNGDGEPLLDMIRIDADVEPGSAGGALVDDRGVVVGIAGAAMRADGAVERRLATDIGVARDAADQILTKGEVSHVWMGVEGPLAWPPAPRSPEGGALVQEVKPNSPAAVGIFPQDVIVAVRGDKPEDQKQPVTSMEGLRTALRAYEPGQVVTVTVRREGVEQDVQVKLGKWPSS